MKFVLYPLVTTRNGRKVGEFQMGSVAFVEKKGTIDIDCPDTEWSQKLRRFFSSALQVRRTRGNTASILTYEWEELYPGNEEYFTEAVARLHTLGIYPKLWS